MRIYDKPMLIAMSIGVPWLFFRRDTCMAHLVMHSPTGVKEQRAAYAVQLEAP